VKLTEGRELNFKSSDWVFWKIYHQYEGTAIYEVEKKDLPIYLLPDEMYTDPRYYYHSPVVKITKLNGLTDKQLEHRFQISKIRSSFDTS